MRMKTVFAAAFGLALAFTGTTAALAEKLVISNWDG